ncbi:MAG: hypothetical protein WCO19_03195 [Candidatus Saccharibacteria bacterium]
MAKNTPKSTNKPQVMNNLKNPKIIASIIVIILLLVVVGALMMSGRKDTTTKVTSARDLAKSSVNTKNTKTIKPKTAADTKTTTAAPATPTTDAGAKKTTTTTTGSTTTTTAPSTPPSGGGATPPPAAPTPEPFAIESAIYSTVDNGYTNIGCNDTARFTVSAYLTANKAGTATYHWLRTDNATTLDRTVVFTGPGTQVVTNSWDLFSDGTPGIYNVDASMKVIVTSPNDAMSKFSDASFTLSVNCM